VVSVRYQHALKKPPKLWRKNRAQSAPTYALHFISRLAPPGCRRGGGEAKSSLMMPPGRSRFPWTHSTSASSFRLRRNSAAVCNRATSPHLLMAEPPRPRIEAIRIVDMSSSNSWAEFAGLFRNTRQAFLDHERASKNRAQGSSCRRTSKRRPKAPLGRKFPLRARSPWRRHPFAALAT
jgi:hypothetical protein